MYIYSYSNFVIVQMTPILLLHPSTPPQLCLSSSSTFSTTNISNIQKQAGPQNSSASASNSTMKTSGTAANNGNASASNNGTSGSATTNSTSANKTEESVSPPPAKKMKCEPKEMVDICVGTSVGTITEPDCLGPCEPGTSVTLEGIVWHETEGGVLVVNVTWRGKTYVGTLLDCTRHDWAPPRYAVISVHETDAEMMILLT